MADRATEDRAQQGRAGFRPGDLWTLSAKLLGEAHFASMFFVVLLIINFALNPARFAPQSLGVTIGLAAPLILAALASTPVTLSGGGGVDLSVGPFMGLVNVIVVKYLYIDAHIASPLVIIPVALVMGLLSGTLNGFLTSIIRIQPIVATLGTYLVYTGVVLWLLPAPTGSVPPWLGELSKGASVLPIALLYAIWWLLRRNPYYEHLMATGGDDRAAYTSGVQVTAVRMVAYIITGLSAAVAGLSLSALLGSADPTVGPTYTLNAIAAIALGGVSLGGGRGGIVGAILGAMDIFLLQSILTFFNVSTFFLQMAFGAILVLAVVLSSEPVRAWMRRTTAARNGVEQGTAQ